MSARRHATVAIVAGALTAVAVVRFVPWELTGLVAWDVTAAVFVAWVWLALGRLDPTQTRHHAEREDPGRRSAHVILVIAAVVSLMAVAALIIRGAPHGTLNEALKIAFGIGSVMASWTVIHTVYALRYAGLYYHGDDGGIDFNQPEKPRYSDFAYFAFTVGMTYQVSDTPVTESRVRANLLGHSLLSFLFGTVILALTINLVAGLSH